MAGLLRLITIIKDLTPIINQIDPWVKKIGGAGFFIIAVNLASSINSLSEDATQMKKELREINTSMATIIERTQTQKEIILDHSNDLKQINHRLFTIEKSLK